MKISKELFDSFKKEVEILSKKIDLTEFKKKMLTSGNSETRFAWDIFYIAQIGSKYRIDIDTLDLNDSHIETAMKKILKNY